MSYHPKGTISNGPGDPQKCPDTIATARKLIENIPTLGICLVHK
jgi:carbamoyl-phosphate synthase small subunit